MTERRFQFRLADVFGIMWACGFLAAVIANPDSNWLMIIAIGSIAWGAWQLRHAERRPPTRAEVVRLLLTAGVVTVGAITLAAVVIFAILRSAHP
jgi:hypothetical protein